MRRRRITTATAFVTFTLAVGATLGDAVARTPIGSGPQPNAEPSRTAAETAVAAARSVVGVPYVFGGADRHGFDCSGLTMWAWAHAGVTLRHSTRSQRDETRHVSRSKLRPGDLVFFYQPIHHVGIYIGRGRMIDANHDGGSVRKREVYWGSFSGGGRPVSEG